MAEYACKCLNVRVRTLPAQGAPPRGVRTPKDDAFVPALVAENGISVVRGLYG